MRWFWQRSRFAAAAAAPVSRPLWVWHSRSLSLRLNAAAAPKLLLTQCQSCFSFYFSFFLLSFLFLSHLIASCRAHAVTFSFFLFLLSALARSELFQSQLRCKRSSSLLLLLLLKKTSKRACPFLASPSSTTAKVSAPAFNNLLCLPACLSNLVKLRRTLTNRWKRTVWGREQELFLLSL